MFNNMLDGIKVNVGVDRDLRKRIKGDLTVWTGRISEYFDLAYGHLPYRSLRFEHTRVKRDPMYTWDKGSVINECNTKPFKPYYGQQCVSQGGCDSHYSSHVIIQRNINQVSMIQFTQRHSEKVQRYTRNIYKPPKQIRILYS